jgi:hypothetical protein
MNKAQKRTWICLVISFITLIISAIVITYFWRNEINIYDFSNLTPAKVLRYRALAILSAIPLVLIVIIEARFRKKDFDERDKIIYRKSILPGLIGIFVFLGGASLFLVVITKAGSIKAPLLYTLVYLACFVWILVSSSAALIQYGRGGGDN